ncbi:MAG: hypothetical protein ACLFU0_04505 [Alphaproteobacteria bacterium]
MRVISVRRSSAPVAVRGVEVAHEAEFVRPRPAGEQAQPCHLGERPVDRLGPGHRGGGRLRAHGLAGLPAEAAHGDAVVDVAPDAVGAAADAVAVFLLRVFAGEPVRRGHRHQPAQPDHRLRHPRAGHRLGVQGPVREVVDAVGRLSPRHDLGA